MRPLFIFDFDDTIAHTSSKIVIHHADGSASEMTSGEFADYRHEPGDELDQESETPPQTDAYSDETIASILAGLSADGFWGGGSSGGGGAGSSY